MEHGKKSDSLIGEWGIMINEVNCHWEYGGPVASQHYYLYIGHSGTLEMEYDTNRLQFGAHDMAIVYPQHVIRLCKASADYRATQVIVTARTYDQMAKLKMSTKRIMYEEHPYFHLSDTQYDDMVSMLNALRHLCNLEVAEKESILVHSTYILSCVIDSFHSANVVQDESPQLRLSSRFYKAIIEHHVQHHDVQFYARLFCLSDKHFSRVIKEETGHPASYWIQKYIIAIAQQILCYEPETSIQAVGDRLGFEDPTSFSRFFKRGYGISPTEYRDTVTADTIEPDE